MRIVLTKEEALKMFEYNPFKQQLILNKIPEGKKTTAYRCGPLIDLCTGPHVPHTARIKAFKVEKNSSAYWLGKNTNDSLQRVYGISFPSKKELADHVHFQEEAARRDHINCGRDQELFWRHHFSPGSTWFTYYGSYIYNQLIEIMRGELRCRGYQEIISPNIFNLRLWKTSGHY